MAVVEGLSSSTAFRSSDRISISTQYLPIHDLVMMK